MLLSRSPLGYLGLLLPAAGGLVAAGGLAWFMHTLIQSSHGELNESSRSQRLDFVRVAREERVETRERAPERIDPGETPEAPPTSSPQQSMDNFQTVGISDMAIDASADMNIDGFGIGTGDGEYLPIVKVAPVYPMRALQQGIEGNCAVEYTVTTTGTVRDISVVPGLCDHAMFERPSIEAARKFKYKPRVMDGTAIEVPGVLNNFSFQIQDDQVE